MGDIKEKESFEQVRAKHYHNVFSGASSEFVIQDLMKFCNYINSSFNEQYPNSDVTIFNEGRRSVILYILSLLQVKEDRVREYLNSEAYNNEYKKSVKMPDDFTEGLY